VNISNNSFEITKTNCFRVARIMFPPEPEVHIHANIYPFLLCDIGNVLKTFSDAR